MAGRDYSALTRVGAGTPMGELLRRYWIPAATSEEIDAGGGAPIRIKLLGEALVGFRDPQGTIGLLGEFCPHRGASLFYARNEIGGLRCLYHGWKLSERGAVLETPAEPADSKLRESVCHKAYPVREAGGIVWTYMGAPDKVPPFPRFPWLELKPPHLLVVKMYQDCNYLQGVEGDLDPAHPNYLHRDFDAGNDESWRGAGWQSVVKLMYDGAPRLVCEETAYSMHYAAIRKTEDPAINYVRVFECIAPFYSYVAAGPHESRLFKAWHPIDDNSCFTFYVHFDADKPLDPEAIWRNWGHRTRPPDFKTSYNLQNRHLQSRDAMERNYSGINGAAIQDLALQESMGPIYDRTQENLGASDRVVAFYRRLMLKLIEDNEAGRELPAQDPQMRYDQRGVSIEMPADRPWQEAIEWQERYEKEHPVLAPAR